MAISKLTEEQCARLEQIEARDGRIRTSRVLDDAMDEASPLHSLYDWDVESAAREHWLNETRKIIRVYSVHQPSTERKLVNVRVGGQNAYEEGEYVRLEHVVRHRSLYQAAHDDAIAALRSARRNLEELESVAARQGVDVATAAAIGHVDQAMESIRA